MRRATLSVLLMAAACRHSAPSADAGVDGGIAGVDIVYLIPSDKPERTDLEPKLRRALENLQVWTARHADGGTFRIVEGAMVKVQHSAHDSAWFNRALDGGNERMTFFDHALGEGFQDWGVATNHVRLLYVDADPACGSVFGGEQLFRFSGVAVMPANDIRGFEGKTAIDLCTGAPMPALGYCRWVGGMGHELGHALGLPHPPGCDQGRGKCDNNALMQLGYASFPNTYLRADELVTLGMNPIFGAMPLVDPSAACP